MESLLMRASEVADALGLGRSKAYELMHNGTLPVVRIGRAIRVPRASLDSWVKEQVTPGIQSHS